MKKIILLTSIALIFLLIYWLSFIFYINPRNYLRKEAEIFLNRVNNELSQICKSFDGRFYFVLKDLYNPYIYLSKDGQKPLIAASLIKVPIMVAVFYAIDKGKLNFNDKFIIEKKDITNGSGKLKYLKLPQQFSLAQLIEFMIAESDNTATNKIIDILGFDYINGIFKEIGLRETVLNRKIMDLSARRKGIENYISLNDLILIYEDIYYGKILNPQYSKLMLYYLKRQKISDRIPKFLPNNVTVAHKTGLEKNVVGDGGIIFSDRGDYILCIAVECGSYSEGKDFIAKISLMVYNAFKNVRLNIENKRSNKIIDKFIKFHRLIKNQLPLKERRNDEHFQLFA
ncbi:MAG: class A beta-lactamase-related serine hydrolase [Candidatus Omnitrophica bacterium]|nr:class A beta-lactamase-related serine hydrolase [Candidatus Omnitrophota bacterium]